MIYTHMLYYCGDPIRIIPDALVDRFRIFFGDRPGWHIKILYYCEGRR